MLAQPLSRLTTLAAGVVAFLTWARSPVRAQTSAIAWGTDTYGQCEVPPLPPGIDYVSVEAGSGHSLALRSDGIILAWGWNAFGQCDVPALPPGIVYTRMSSFE